MKNAPRKNVVKYRPAERGRAIKVELSGWWYAGCPQCGRRFTVNAHYPEGRVCQDCSTLGPYGRPMWDRESDPKTCCLAFSEPITDRDTLQNYRCGGDTPWWLCSGCHRAHPYNPNDPTRGGKAA